MLLDGNEMAGALGELFTVDMTVARGRCAGCGRVSALAQTAVFDQGPGVVARCPTCEAVLLRVVRAPGRAFIDLSGMTCLQVSLPD